MAMKQGEDRVAYIWARGSSFVMASLAGMDAKAPVL